MNDQHYGTNDPQDGPGTEPTPPADDAGANWQETQAFAPYGSSSDDHGYEQDDEPPAGRAETVTTTVAPERPSGGRGALWWAVAGVVGVLLTVGVVWGALSLTGSGDDAEQAAGEPGVSASATASSTDEEAAADDESTAAATDGADAAQDGAAGEGAAGGGAAGGSGAAAPPSSQNAGTAGELASMGKYTITIEDFGLDATEWLVGAGLPEPKNGRYAMVMLRGTYTGTGPGTPRDDLVVGVSAGGKEWLDNGCKPVALADVSLDEVASGEEFVGSVCIDMTADEVEAPVLFVQDKRSGTRTTYQF